MRELFLNPAPFTVDLTSMWTTTKNKNRTSPDKQIIKFQTSVAVSGGHCNGSLAHLPPKGIKWLKTSWTTIWVHRRADHRRTDLCDLMESSDHRWWFCADRWNRWGSPRPLEPNGGAQMEQGSGKHIPPSAFPISNVRTSIMAVKEIVLRPPRLSQWRPNDNRRVSWTV